MDNNRRISAFGISLIIHGLIILVLFLIVIKTPIPPFPEQGGGGVEVNFGIDVSGSGDIQPENISEEVNVKTETAPSINSSSDEEELLLSENEEVEIEKKKANKKKENKKKTENKQETEKEVKNQTTENNNNNKQTEEVKEEKKSPVALYKGSKNISAGSQGENGGKGDQGDPEGDPLVKYQGKKTGSGGGGNGSGNGTGDGIGDGVGNGKEKGVSFSLQGRSSKNLSIPKDKFDESGKVVVEIFVDKQGNVVRAKPGIKGSSTSNEKLLQIAKKAAMSSKFTVNDNAPDEQRGTITYVFILK